MRSRVGSTPALFRQAASKAFRDSPITRIIEAITNEWLSHMKDKWSDDHYSYTERRFKAYVFNEIGSTPIAEVSTPSLLAMARKMESQGTIETAHTVMNTCSQVFRYAIASGRCERNPVTDLRGALKPKPAPKHMSALSVKELPDLLRKIDTYANDGGEMQTQYALQLLALTFVRTGELREATWEEFDLDKAEWRIPAERMKMKAPHLVPLSKQAVDVLKKLNALNGAYSLV